MGESVWETVGESFIPTGPKIRSTARHAIKHRSWPNPFRNAVKSINVLACEDTWQAMVEMYFVGFGNWFFSSFIPSPVELSRKFVAGSYKCGFYMLPKIASPLDIIWRDAKTSRALMEISSPLTRGLFYFWAAETAFGFLNTWSSLIHAGDFCDATGAECLLADGRAAFGGGTHHEIGDVALYSVLYDPLNRYPELGGGPEPLAPANFSATAAGQFVMGTSEAKNARVWIYYGQEGQQQALGTLAPLSVTSFSVSATGFIGAAQPVVVRFECDVEGDTIIPNVVQVDRFTTSFGAPTEPPPPGTVTDYKEKDYMCRGLYNKVYAVGVG